MQLPPAFVALGVAAVTLVPVWPAPVMETYTSAHFVFHHTPLDARTIKDTAAALENEYARILEDLGVDAMPRVHVTFYVDHQSLEAAVRPVVDNIPSWSVGLVTAPDQIHLMSPNHPTWAPYSRMVKNLVHEFAHAVSMKLNQTIPNRPRWWWEAVALYEAGQRVNPRTLPYMLRAAPSFSQLDRMDTTTIYEVGYTIAEFVVTTWGQQGVRNLTLNNGDISLSFNISQAEFEARWYAFVRQTYGLG